MPRLQGCSVTRPPLRLHQALAGERSRRRGTTERVFKNLSACTWAGHMGARTVQEPWYTLCSKKARAASFKEGTRQERVEGEAVNSEGKTGVACGNWQGQEKIIRPHLMKRRKKKNNRRSGPQKRQPAGRTGTQPCQFPGLDSHASCQGPLPDGKQWHGGAPKGKSSTGGGGV